MRTITAVALSLAMLFTVATAHATTSKKHHRKHHAASTEKKADAEKPAATKDKAPAK